MNKLNWSPQFIRTFKRLVRQKPQMRSAVEQTLQQLALDPFHPTLRTHKLKGELTGIWSCSIDYSYRILFKFIPGPDSEEEEVYLLTLGSHDDVYRK